MLQKGIILVPIQEMVLTSATGNVIHNYIIEDRFSALRYFGLFVKQH